MDGPLGEFVPKVAFFIIFTIYINNIDKLQQVLLLVFAVNTTLLGCSSILGNTESVFRECML